MKLKHDFETTSELPIRPWRDPIKRETKYGVFLWWSDQTPSWVYPDDSEIVDRLVPGNRIFRREECENYADRELGYSRLIYGEIEFRALPFIWMEVKHEGFEINDFVEVKSRYGKLRPRIATIREIVWNRHSRVIEYFLSINGQRASRSFSADEFQPAIRLRSHLSDRELKLTSRARFA